MNKQRELRCRSIGGCGTTLGIFAFAFASKRHAEEEGRSHAKQTGKGFHACPSQSLFPRLRPGATPLDWGGIQDGAERACANWGGKTFQVRARPHVRCQGSHPRRRSKRQQSRRASLQLPQPPKGARKRCPEPRQKRRRRRREHTQEDRHREKGGRAKICARCWGNPCVAIWVMSHFHPKHAFGIMFTSCAGAVVMLKYVDYTQISLELVNRNASMLLYVLNFLSNALRKFKEYVTISEMSH